MTLSSISHKVIDIQSGSPKIKRILHGTVVSKAINMINKQILKSKMFYGCQKSKWYIHVKCEMVQKMQIFIHTLFTDYNEMLKF